MIDPANESRRLRRLQWGVRVEPLVKPYDLSFVQLTAFDVVWVLAEDDQGRVGIGEAVPLPGYNWETIETIRASTAAICEGAVGATVSSIVRKCRDFRRDHPFAASAVMAALDMPAFLDQDCFGRAISDQRGGCGGLADLDATSSDRGAARLSDTNSSR